MTSEELATEYDRLRDELKRLLAAPVKDMSAVNRVIDELDAVRIRRRGTGLVVPVLGVRVVVVERSRGREVDR